MPRTHTFATGPVQLDSDGAHLRKELARELSEALGEPWEVLAERSYAALSERVAGGGAELAWLPPASFVRAHDAGALDRVLSAERAGGAGYQAALFVRSDSATTTLDELRGKRVAWVDRDSAAGFLFPQLELSTRGFGEDFFGEERFVESHARVVRAVRDGEVDVGATFAQGLPVGTPEGTLALGPLALVGWAPFVAPSAMRPILVSRPIPADALCLTNALPEGTRAAVTALLESTPSRPRLARLLRSLMNADRFLPSHPRSYDAVREAIRVAASRALPVAIPPRAE